MGTRLSGLDIGESRSHWLSDTLSDRNGAIQNESDKDSGFRFLISTCLTIQFSSAGLGARNRRSREICGNCIKTLRFRRAILDFTVFFLRCASFPFKND